MPPLALTDYQLRLVRQAAETMPVSGRDEFLRGVAQHLGNEPTDEAVIAAIDGQLAINRVPTFLCDSTKEIVEMSRAKFFDRTGKEVSANDALNRDGSTLRDGFTARIATQFRDAAASRHRPLITDGYGNSGLALQRPGFRLRTDAARQQVVADSYAAYERSLVAAYLGDTENQCIECFGEGDDEDGKTCSTCGGGGVEADERERDRRPSNYGSSNEPARRNDDHRSVSLDPLRRGHQTNMAKLHAQLDFELSQQWRGK